MALLLSSNVDTFARKPVRSERIRALRMSGNFFFFSLSLFKINSKEGRKRKRGIRSRSNFYRRFIKMNENRKRRKEREYYGFFSATGSRYYFPRFVLQKEKRIRAAAKKNLFAKSFPLPFSFYSPNASSLLSPLRTKAESSRLFSREIACTFRLVKKERKKDRKVERGEKGIKRKGWRITRKRNWVQCGCVFRRLLREKKKREEWKTRRGYLEGKKEGGFRRETFTIGAKG